MIGRREFITLLGGAAAAWPAAATAQQSRPPRRMGVFLYLKEQDSESKPYVSAFEGQLRTLGWMPGTNLKIDYRWTGGDAGLIRQYAAELVSLAPDVILAAGGSHVGPLQQVTSTIPIVFVQVTDPVGAGFVDSLARPGRNATGFTVFDYDIGGKWLELLKQIAPAVTRVAVLRDPANPSGTGLFGAIQALAPSQKVEASPLNLRDASALERNVDEFARKPNGGLIILPNSLAIVQRKQIIARADRHRLPAVYPFRYFVTEGGLIYYGPDPIDQYRQASGYVSRLLKGEKLGDLPVQAPTKYEMVINLKTAKALGLTVPLTLQAAANEVIE
jgi:putative ABC transport system substrate-binding protein